MSKRHRTVTALKEMPALMISTSSMCNQYKFAVHDKDGKYLCDVEAKSKRYAVATAKLQGHKTASKAYQLEGN